MTSDSASTAASAPTNGVATAREASSVRWHSRGSLSAHIISRHRSNALARLLSCMSLPPASTISRNSLDPSPNHSATRTTPAPDAHCPTEPVTSTALTMTKSGNDIAFDWSPVNTDSTGNTELIGGYEVRSSTKPTVALPLPVVSTAGPRSAALVPGEALGVAEIAY